MAKVYYYDPVNDLVSIKHHGHRFGFGGHGDGYCYSHQSFDCLDNMTSKDWEAMDKAMKGLAHWDDLPFWKDGNALEGLAVSIALLLAVFLVIWMLIKL